MGGSIGLEKRNEGNWWTLTLLVQVLVEVLLALQLVLELRGVELLEGAFAGWNLKRVRHILIGDLLFCKCRKFN